MPRLQGLIFDLDGTLLDSAPDLRQAVNLMLKQHGRRELTLDEVKKMTGDGLMAMMERAFTATGNASSRADSYSLFQQFIGFYRNIRPDPAQIYPHAQDVLDLCRTAGIKLGICTNKQEAATVRLLEQLKLLPYFSFIAGGDTFPVHKPHPGHVSGVIDRLQVPTTHCAMIGDGTNDVLAAKGAGIPCIVVTHGYGGDVEQIGADKLIDGFDELQKALGELGFQFS